MAKTFDPLSCIPSVDVIRGRLTVIQEEARRLGVLLRTAEAIEQMDRHGTNEREGGDDAK